jgi:cytochrome P450
MSLDLPDPSDAVFVPRDADTWRDPFTMYRALRAHDPVHHVEDGDYWVLSRFHDVLEAAVDTATFSSAHGLTFAYGEMEEIGIEAPIVMMDPPEHTALRKLLAPSFTAAKVAALEETIRDFVVERVERLRAMGEADVVAELFKPLPSMIVAYFLGVPQEDRELFDRWTDSIVAANASGDLASGGDAVVEMFGYFGALIERRRGEPGQDTFSVLVHAELNGEPVSMEKILGFGFTMVTGGNDTTTGLLGGAAELLTRRPDQRRRLLEDPARIPGAVEEFLRLTTPVQGLARMTMRDVEIDGRTVPAGKKVMLLYASANRDEAAFGPTSEELDVGREQTRHVAFSFGRHYCIGAHAARLAARVALEELLSRCPSFSVDYERGRFAGGHFVRRYEALPFTPT